DLIAAAHGHRRLAGVPAAAEKAREIALLLEAVAELLQDGLDLGRRRRLGLDQLADGIHALFERLPDLLPPSFDLHPMRDSPVGLDLASEERDMPGIRIDW